MPEILDYDPLTGETVTMQYGSDGSMTFCTSIDMEPIFDENKRVLLEADHKRQLKQSWVKYASGITNVLILKWRQEHGVDFFNENHWPRVMELLNSREYRKLKTTELVHDR